MILAGDLVAPVANRGGRGGRNVCRLASVASLTPGTRQDRVETDKGENEVEREQQNADAWRRR